MSSIILNRAKAARNDEFYTRYEDIEKELTHYKQHFKDKTVYCNCDNPGRSNFWRYFHLNFSELGLKKLISTHYESDKTTYKKEYAGGDDDNISAGIVTTLEGRGDFRDLECLDILDQCDIVVTNPPFSLFREYVDIMLDHQKQFLILGSINAITYKKIFHLIKDNKLRIGYCKPNKFFTPEGPRKVTAKWFTNLDTEKQHENLILNISYSPALFPKYDNYDAINVNKVCDIPRDYTKEIGVPITFLDKWNPDQFEIIGADFELARPQPLGDGKFGTFRFYVKGQRLYSRIVIRKK